MFPTNHREVFQDFVNVNQHLSAFWIRRLDENCEFLQSITNNGGVASNCGRTIKTIKTQDKILGQL